MEATKTFLITTELTTSINEVETEIIGVTKSWELANKLAEEEGLKFIEDYNFSYKGCITNKNLNMTISLVDKHNYKAFIKVRRINEFAQ